MQLKTTFVLAVLAIVGGCGDESTKTADAAIDVMVVDVIPDAPEPDALRVCDLEERDDDYVAGMSKVGANGYRFTLVTSTPAPAGKGVYTWEVQVHDPASQPFDAPMLTVFPFMPDHHHGTSAATITPMTNGMYTISALDLFMTGYWTIRLGVRDVSSVELDFARFAFCVD